jgi:uncharacterized protein YukE
MTDFGVVPDQLAQSAWVFTTEADIAHTALTAFKGQVQQLQDTYQAVPPEDWAGLMTDLENYTKEYCAACDGIGSGLRKSSVNYADIEDANAKLVPVNGYTPVTHVDMKLHPGISLTTAAVAAGDPGG